MYHAPSFRSVGTNVNVRLISMPRDWATNDRYVSETRPIHAEREFLKDAHWPRMLGPGCGVLFADPQALLRLSLPNAGWRPVPRARRFASSSLARVPFLLARGASRTHRIVLDFSGRPTPH